MPHRIFYPPAAIAHLPNISLVGERPEPFDHHPPGGGCALRERLLNCDIFLKSAVGFVWNCECKSSLLQKWNNIFSCAFTLFIIQVFCNLDHAPRNITEAENFAFYPFALGQLDLGSDLGADLGSDLGIDLCMFPNSRTEYMDEPFVFPLKIAKRIGIWLLSVRSCANRLYFPSEVYSPRFFLNVRLFSAIPLTE